ncbi:TrmB family transcriptional regulator [Pseudonocardia nantongensis]|uniref:TrmB family transcriptional regulator n=1 Tax=Pseudonocardia nantongensis TaxID=1181885 RepID=UPI0039789326
MPQQRVVEELRNLGMSGYEAKAYVALVAAGEPVNGYEVAKRSGVPRSTVYETLGKLVGRGAAYEVRADDDGVGYVPLPPEALLDRMRRDFDSSVATLEADLPGLASPEQVRMVHSLNERAALVDRARDVVVGATAELFVSGWPDDLAGLKPAVRDAEQTGVQVATVVFGRDADPVGWTTEHRYSSPETVEANLGRRLLVVAADRTKAVIGGLAGDRTWGLYTDDPAAVLLAVDYVRHDIAMHRVADHYADRGFAEFWGNDPGIERLRDLPDPPGPRS